MGGIFYHKNLTYHDGATGGKKPLVLLNEPRTREEVKEGYVFAKTTSQQKNRQRTPPCNIKWSEFFIPGGADWFESDTWVQLDELFVFEADTVIKDRLTGDLAFKSFLKDETLGGLKNCALKCDDVSEVHKSIIKHAYEKRFRT